MTAAGKNLDLGARAGAGISIARGASKAAMEKATKAQEAATKAAKLAEERSREVASEHIWNTVCNVLL